ncbi:PREDICTED: protein arginine N-methyltransferase 5 [Rhagoletis zephyria]|uniref:protein arginine N-methyltransferase 5 n=1 Tax=Rhagoletis zephyria TaxID=28612 RepID=UPI00081125A7|nr:PREDICTED: protein arginine N-methyltransferase 5 [Rhagoletis zephyria]
MPYLCLLQDGNESLPRLMEKAQQSGYAVVAAPINATEIPLEFQEPPMCDRQTEFTYSDLIFPSDQWNGKVISMLSDTIDCEAEDPVVRRNAEEVLKRDISWAEHLQYGGYTMLQLKSERNLNMARIASCTVKGLLLVQVPLYNSKVAQSTWRRDIDEEQLEHIEQQDTWHWWNSFRWAADFNPKIKLALELSESDRPSLEVVRRWIGEPVEAIIIPSTMFICNRQNYPVLPKTWQEILSYFTRARVNIIISSDVNDVSLKLYAEYMLRFMETHGDFHELQAFEDVLEEPLQPLYDNLDCYTYEVFEKDPAKYKLYQEAIEQALLDRVPEKENKNTLTVIMVLGAGRGPLVRSALNAGENTGRKVRVYIIEKNPNAIRTLNAIAKKLWNNKDVHIFSKDMREFSPPEPADILVSELLGSFGDNELSPECLDCAQKLLKPDGISIPCKSTSYINPIMSSKLLNGVRQVMRHETFGRQKQATYHTHAESGFVVLLKNIYNIGLPQPLFEFVHPNPQQPIDNSRYKALSFDVEMDCVLTGIAGYFDTVLYKDIKLSINPQTHTPGMFSWFPMYFPFADPMDVKKGQTIEIHFWRCVTKQKIWYEWCLASPFRTHIHNHGGRSCPIYCT